MMTETDFTRFLYKIRLAGKLASIQKGITYEEIKRCICESACEVLGIRATGIKRKNSS